MKRAWPAFAVAIHLFAATAAPPVLTIRSGNVSVALPEHILDKPEVRKQLASALTTTIVIVARSRDAAKPMRSRLEIRFDLWDQIYHVRRVEMGRATDQRKLSSLAELKQWWRTPLHVLDVGATRAAIDLQLLVLPFSAAEEGDAREWLEKSGGVGTEQTAAAGVVGAMIGTTIQARPIATFRWNLQASER